MDKIRIQIVEDDSITAQYIKKSLETYGYEVLPTVRYAEEAVNAASEKNPDLFLMDINLGGKKDGIDAAAEIYRLFGIPVIYLTAFYDSTILERAKTTGAYGYIIKPVDVKTLSVVVEIAFSKYKLEKELNENRRWLDTILGSIGEAVITTDAQGCIKFLNPVAETFTGWKQPEALGRALAEILHLVNEKSGEKISDITGTAIRNKKPVFSLSGHNVLVARNGQKTPIDHSVAPIVGANGNIDGVVMAFRNSTERIQMEDTLRVLSWIDELTELYNRRGFIQMAEHHLKLSDRTKKGLFLIFADVDKLKFINDTYGHLEGDQALIETAGLLKGLFRGSDIIARIGGDEFAALLTEAAENSAAIITERLQAELATLNKREGRKYQLSISFGIIQYDLNAPAGIEKLLHQADQLMYAQKKHNH
ncbi:MAG: diguanylate cyclase [Candidatus Omnitrophica bacterium]|nr:diguanylate cyclase [Candidatus Omnitrophota bacterium]